MHKCAGTSVETALSKILSYNDILIGSTKVGEDQQEFFKRTIGLNKHSGASDVKAFVGEEAWDNFFTFAFVRHPIDRLYSLYNYSRRMVEPFRHRLDEFDPNDVGTYPKTPPFTFHSVRSVLQSADFNDYVLNECTWRDPGSARQADSLCENGELILKRVFKVENIDAAWKRISDRFPGIDTLNRLNDSSPEGVVKNPKSLLGKEALSKVLEFYSDDFRIFDYDI